MRTLITIATFLLMIGCTNSQIKTEKKEITSHNLIKMPPNSISEKECSLKGGKVWNTIGKTSYNGELIGTIKGLKCPCVCLVESSKN